MNVMESGCNNMFSCVSLSIVIINCLSNTKLSHFCKVSEFETRDF